MERPSGDWGVKAGMGMVCIEGFGRGRKFGLVRRRVGCWGR